MFKPIKNYDMRKEVAYWFMFLAGIALMIIQITKYAYNSLELNIQEFFVTVVSIALMIFPRFLLQAFEKIINTKKNEK